MQKIEKSLTNQLNLRCATFKYLNTLQIFSIVNITTKPSVLTQIMFDTLVIHKNKKSPTNQLNLRCSTLTYLITLQILSFVHITTKHSVLTQIMFNTLVIPL